MGASVPSFGPLINPSSETASPVRTFLMFVLPSMGLRHVRGPDSGVVTRGVVVDDEEGEFGGTS
jgi:hypothetical protein